MQMFPVIYIDVALKGTSDAHFPQVDIFFSLHEMSAKYFG